MCCVINCECTLVFQLCVLGWTVLADLPIYLDVDHKCTYICCKHSAKPCIVCGAWPHSALSLYIEYQYETRFTCWLVQVSSSQHMFLWRSRPRHRCTVKLYVVISFYTEMLHSLQSMEGHFFHLKPILWTTSKKHPKIGICVKYNIGWLMSFMISLVCRVCLFTPLVISRLSLSFSFFFV